MARINLDDKLFKEQGFQDLMIAVGNRRMAKGIVWELYVLAQKFWFPDRLPIPLDVFKAAEFPEVLYSANGLCELREGGVYARGSEEQFKWLFQKSEAGKKPKKLPTKLKTPKRVLTDVSARPTGDNGIERLESSLLSSLSSFLTSNYSYLKTNISSEDAALLFDLCFAEFPARVEGPKARERFETQLKTFFDIREFAVSIGHYNTMLSLPENAWRRPKTTFEAYLGTKSSGRFWRDYVNPDSCLPTTKKTTALSDDDFADELLKKHEVQL